MPGGVVHVSGQVFLENRLLDPSELASFLAVDATATKSSGPLLDAFTERVARLNGFFALIVELDDWLFAAADRLSSIPLFYSGKGRGLIITDSLADERFATGANELNAAGAYDFLYAGYVTGSATLSRSYMQLESGQCLLASRSATGEIALRTHFRFMPRDEIRARTDEEFNDRFLETMRGVFDRLSMVANGRTICVPLSGGWDSRLIVALLRKFGFSRVLCYSYGLPEDEEVFIGKAVAEALGYEWRFARYETDMWRTWMARDKTYAYWAMCSNLVSLPNFHDLPAVEQLVKEGRDPDDMIFVPGHSGDFLAGSHIPFDMIQPGRRSATSLAKRIIEKHYKLWPHAEHPGELSSRLLAQLSLRPESKYSADEAIRLFECWDFHERQSKYIANSVRAYEFVGASWHMPLWDGELIDLLLQPPVPDRIGQHRYIEALCATVFTGGEGSLSTIPIAGKDKRTPANWRYASPRAGGAFRRMARHTLSRLGLQDPLRRRLHRFQPFVGHRLGFNDGLARGKAPEVVSLRESLGAGKSQYAVLNDMVTRYGDETLPNLDSLGMLAAHTLKWILEREDT